MEQNDFNSNGSEPVDKSSQKKKEISPDPYMLSITNKDLILIQDKKLEEQRKFNIE